MALTLMRRWQRFGIQGVCNTIWKVKMMVTQSDMASYQIRIPHWQA